MLVKDEGLNNCTSWIFELSTILVQCRGPAALSAQHPSHDKDDCMTIQNLVLFMSVGKGKTKVRGDGPAVSRETPEFQPHSLSTYSWVICFLQMWSSETSTSSFLCVSPRNWKCTDDTKPPMSVMNQNWVCGSMWWTKPPQKKAAEEESSTTVQIRKIFWQKCPPETLLPLLLTLKHSIHQVLNYLLQLESLIFQWENMICYRAVCTWLRNKHQMTVDGDKVLLSAGSLGLFTANFSFTYFLQRTFL